MARSRSKDEDLQSTLQSAIRFHTSGHLAEASKLYQSILRSRPEHPETLQYLGVLAHQTGDSKSGATLIRRAISISPKNASFYCNLGPVLRATGDFAGAEEAYRRAVQLNPDLLESWTNLGTLAAIRGNYDEAEKCFRLVLQRQPENALVVNNLAGVFRNTGRLHEAASLLRAALENILGNPDLHVTLGNVELGLENLDEAEHQFRLAIALAPHSAEAHVGLGAALMKLQRSKEAEASLRTAISLDERNSTAHNNLACILSERGEDVAAEAMFRHALSLEPNNASARCNLGRWLLDRRFSEKAAIELNEALRLDPRLPETHMNLGSLLLEQGKLDESLASLNRAAELSPRNPEVLKSRALLLMLKGELEQGFHEFEARLVTREFADLFPKGSGPRWRGESLVGRTIMIVSEQGIGDTLQFIRYGLRLQQLGAKVIAAVPPMLQELLRSCPGIDWLVSKLEPAPPHDYCVALMSIPGILMKLGDPLGFGESVPYLHADPIHVEIWKQKLATYPGFKVGIQWQGRRGYRYDAFRSMPLKTFAPLAEIPGVQLFSLQKGDGRDQLDEWGKKLDIVDISVGLDEKTGAFVETAAVMQNLDLVISIDSALTHLAGALGLPVWLTLGPVPDWRWFLNRTDSPFYPTVRIFREFAYKNWTESFSRIANELRIKVASHNRVF